MGISFSQFVPEYDGGTKGTDFYNAGTLLEDDEHCGSRTDFPMLLIADTDENGFAAYVKKLTENGFTVCFENENGAYHAVEAESADTRVYVYLTKQLGEVRIIEEKAGVKVSDFGYDFDGQPEEIYQYALCYHPTNGHSPTMLNCGMLYIIKLADNSLFVIDGGHMVQCCEETMVGLYNFMKNLTGSETINVAAWYFTHAHDDHCAECARLLFAYKEKINVQRVMFNYPSNQTCPYSPMCHIMKEAVRIFAPECKALKLQSGMTFNLAGTRFDVLYTHEDGVNIEKPSKFSFWDFNCTSTVLKMTTKGGSVMWLGDTNVETEKLVIRTVPADMWKSDVVQVAHHCFNYLSSLYPLIDAKYAMMPNSYYGAHEEDNLPKLQDVLDHLESPDNIWYESETTGFRFEDGKYKVIFTAPLVGYDWDGKGLYGQQMKIGHVY